MEMSTWPRSDREWARNRIGCNVTTCPNGKCRATEQCIDLPVIPSPPLVPRSYPNDDAPRTIIAFTGLAGSGKSTAAHHLVNRRGFQRVRFAGPLKAMMASLGLTHEQIEGAEKESPCALLG